jgi:hypothetical protein
MGLGPAAQLVAVGVDDGRGAAAATRYAASVARDRGWDLMLVHGGWLEEADDGEAVLDRVLAALALHDGTRVHRVVSADAAVEALRRVSGLVSVLALGQDRTALGEPLVIGPVAAAVISAARGPVVLVPRGWEPEHGAGRPVVAALDADAPAGPPLRCAFVEADLGGVPVVVVRTVAGPTEGDEGEGEGNGQDEAGREAAYAEALTAAHREHPDVEARTVLVPADPEGWVPDPGLLASLVVVGPPLAGLHAGAWARSVAGPLLRRSGCPLLVAPPDDAPPGLPTLLRRRARVRGRRR